uniref:Acyl-CoA synthetase short-chain family member 3, mitochondrial n=1 Tax=Oncorhynchus kisutch TaxID=8019 RepID=A0A8C7N262_ONCKI
MTFKNVIIAKVRPENGIACKGYCTPLAIPNTRSERRLTLGPLNVFNSWTATAQRELRVLSSLSTTNEQQCNRTLTTNNNAYDEAFRTARNAPEQFWGEAAQNVTWFEPWSRTMDNGDAIFPKWFAGGKLNVCHNAVDRHVESGRGDQPAIIYDSPVTGTKQTITFRELQEQVSRLAGVLVKRGVWKGDLVVIYMPMVPQAMFTMLACARIGAPHSLIFGGFASKELSVRIDHAKPKMIVTASFGIEPGRRVEYIPLVEKALELSSHSPSKVLIYNRPGMVRSIEIEYILHYPLYFLPNGVVRDTAGYAVMLTWTMANIYGLKPGEVWWAASDLGWVVGHSYICYAPLLHGNTTILYEGKPVGTPDAGAFFRVLSEHGCSSMFTAPTAIRAIRQQDTHSAIGAQYPLTRLKSLFLAGEHCDVETLNWAKRSFGVPVLDHWWQTESGSAITSSCIGLGNSLSPPAGQAGKPSLSLSHPYTHPLSLLSSRLPLPPGAALSLWQNQELFKELYFTKFPGFYDTMDAGYVDEEGFLYIMSRSDDVINVAGHRLSAGALEESVLLHPGVVDCAVVGLEDSLKGHVPLALCVLRNDLKKSQGDVVKEIVSLVRETIGPVAAFRKVLIVRGLPKTRSGKIPRSSLANLVNGKPYTISPTIEDPDVYKDIEKMVKQELRPAGQ